jgi:hypothetical protein
MSEPVKPEPKPGDLTQTTEPGSIQLNEKEAAEISAGGSDYFLKLDEIKD